MQQILMSNFAICTAPVTFAHERRQSIPTLMIKIQRHVQELVADVLCAAGRLLAGVVAANVGSALERHMEKRIYLRFSLYMCRTEVATKWAT